MKEVQESCLRYIKDCIGLKQEFKLLSNVKTYLPAEYPYDVPGATRNVKVADFDDKVDVYLWLIHIFFKHKEYLAQSQLQLAQTNPDTQHISRYESMYDALGKKYKCILPPPAQPTPLDPSLEEIAAVG